LIAADSSSRPKVTQLINNNSPEVVELINNSPDVIFVDERVVSPNTSILIMCEEKPGSGMLFSIKHGIKKYNVFFDGTGVTEKTGPVKLDFTTIKYMAQDIKKQLGFDEICLLNDTPYDILVSHHNCSEYTEAVKDEHRKTGIAIEPGTTPFHKSIYCAKAKAGNKQLRALGNLVLSVSMAENKNYYHVPYLRRVYTHPSLVGNKGWKTITLSANTIKLLNKGFSVSCS